MHSGAVAVCGDVAGHGLPEVVLRDANGDDMAAVSISCIVLGNGAYITSAAVVLPFLDPASLVRACI